jgi:subtilisin-like proprotein convertase family protein
VDDATNNLSGGIPPTPLTEFNNGGALEVHNSGEVWTLTLWEVRARVIAANGGDVPTGNQIMLQLVTDALKMTPIDPTFIEARDALIDADCATNACANEQSIWDGFADRGLGYKASAPLAVVFGYNAGHTGIKESFAAPNLDTQAVVIDDSLGNNNGSIDPGEPIKLTVTLNNPWRNAAKGVASATATLTALTAGVTVVDGNSAYGPIPALGSAAGDVFQFTVPLAAACGQSLKFTLQTSSTLGAGSGDIVLRVGQATGTGAPITYTKTHAPGLAIPDGPRPRGVISTLNVTDDYEIADLDFRVDSVSHTFTGDLTFMLKGPTGYGAELVGLIGGLIDGGPGDNITNMVIDDDIALSAANDMVQASAAAAPYTKSWLPVFNAPWPPLAGFPPEDPVGQLSRFDNTSTQGDWSVVASDQFAADAGTLNSWSLIVTPKTFTCAPFTPPNVTGTKTVAGTFQVGGTVTYNVVLTNSGTGTQLDNPGNEFTDVLPPTLTLTGALANSGTVAQTGPDTVTWNGALAGGASVTIAIVATVNANAANTTVCNQGAISFDSDSDSTNNASGVTDNPGTGAPNDPTCFFVPCPTVTLAPTLAGGVQGTAYNQSVVVGPTNGYTFAVTTNVLPPGLSLNAATGAITGTPSAPGNYTFVVTATGLNGCAKSQSYNLLITGTCATITVNPTTLPNGTLGTAYPLTTVSATGGVAPYTFAVTQGALPAGLALNGTTGEITGTPTAAGTLSFRITATGQGGCTGSRVYVVSVACATLTFNPTSLPNGAKGVAYNQAITVTPGTGHTFSVLLGSLPPGFTLSAAGILSGLTNQAGTWTFTVKAVLGSCQATKQYTLTIPAPAAPTALAQLNDYDGDAKSDLALFAANGEWRILLSGGSSAQQSQTVRWGTAGDLPVGGDYDGDGKTDVAVFRPSDGTWYVKRSSDGAALVKAWGLSTDVPVPGDYDGDGKTDIAIWRGGEGNWYILRSSDQQFEMASWGLGLAPFNDVPMAGDYDGDGKTDLGVFRRANGVWYVRQSSNGNFLIKQWGGGSDVPVVQDYDGDAKVDLAVWRGATGLWYIQASATGATRATAWGAGFAPYNDQAVPGDYDGDGQADLAVWRAGDATWYLSLSGVSQNSATRVVKLGESGDRPVSARLP